MSDFFPAEDEGARIPTRFWIDALRRRAELEGGFVTVLRRGDDERGDVLVKLIGGEAGVRLLARERDALSRQVFVDRLEPGASETDAAAVIERGLGFDPDLWVIEIEDRQGRHFLTEPVQAR